MCNNYDGILRRLSLYRLKKKLTQTDVAEMLGKTQSQFSKVELGKVVLSYKDLTAMLQAGWDIDFLITGKEKVFWKSTVTEISGLDDINTMSEVKDALVWALGQKISKIDAGYEKDALCEYRLLKRITTQGKGEFLLANLRSIVGASQIGMSERLGVNIKKYRDLEKRNTDLDAELLAQVYENTHCRPSMFFYQDNLEMYLLNNLWNRLDSDERDRLAIFMSYAISLRRV